MRDSTKNTILIQYLNHFERKNPISKYRIDKKESLLLWYFFNEHGCKPILEKMGLEKATLFVETITYRLRGWDEEEEEEHVNDAMQSWHTNTWNHLWDANSEGYIMSIGFNREDGKRCKYEDNMYKKIEAYVSPLVKEWLFNIIPDLIDTILYPRINIFDVDMQELETWINTTTRDEQIAYLQECVDTGWIKP